jgi:hypothetical protein
MSQITAFHGIGAYRVSRNPLALRNALNSALSGVELCAADRPIGAFGAVIFGECTAAFKQDVWSEVDENGLRLTDNADVSDVFYPESQSDWEDFAKDSMQTRMRWQGNYCEVWMKSHVVRALWVKDWADSKTVKAAKIIARRRNIPLIVVDKHERIWNLLDAMRLPFIIAN